MDSFPLQFQTMDSIVVNRMWLCHMEKSIYLIISSSVTFDKQYGISIAAANLPRPSNCRPTLPLDAYSSETGRCRQRYSSSISLLTAKSTQTTTNSARRIDHASSPRTYYELPRWPQDVEDDGSSLSRIPGWTHTQKKKKLPDADTAKLDWISSHSPLPGYGVERHTPKISSCAQSKSQGGATNSACWDTGGSGS